MNLFVTALAERNDIDAPIVAPSAERKDVMPREMVFIDLIVASKAC
jgi:hypothetical protein